MLMQHTMKCTSPFGKNICIFNANKIPKLLKTYNNNNNKIGQVRQEPSSKFWGCSLYHQHAPFSSETKYTWRSPTASVHLLCFSFYTVVHQMTAPRPFTTDDNAWVTHYTCLQPERLPESSKNVFFFCLSVRLSVLYGLSLFFLSSSFQSSAFTSLSFIRDIFLTGT